MEIVFIVIIKIKETLREKIRIFELMFSTNEILRHKLKVHNFSYNNPTKENKTNRLLCFKR